MEKQVNVYERFKKEVYRIGWRVQYRAKTIKRRECYFNGMEQFTITSSTLSSEDRIIVEQLLEALPPQGKFIISQLYLFEQTESEVANQLNMTQQAVNKWKKKMLRKLSQTMNS